MKKGTKRKRENEKRDLLIVLREFFSFSPFFPSALVALFDPCLPGFFSLILGKEFSPKYFFFTLPVAYPSSNPA